MWEQESKSHVQVQKGVPKAISQVAGLLLGHLLFHRAAILEINSRVALN